MSTKNLFCKVMSLLISITMAIMPGLTYALPEGGSGDGYIEVNGQRMDIRTLSDRAIFEWLRFCIENGETVHFYLPSSSSAVLNRVLGGDLSYIFGTLSSNGHVFLINPNGILFGPNSRVDTAGLVASTLDISNEDFLAGRYIFSGRGGSVVNQGYISAPGGYVALLGSHVENTGLIEANLGTVALASGEKITLNLDPQGFISVVVDEATTQNLGQNEDAVKNSGTIKAEGGKVILTASALNGVFDRAVNNEGIIEAQSLANKKGEVYLTAAGTDSLVSNTGTIDVSAKEELADGGFVELSADNIDFAGGIIKTNTINGKNGQILFDPWNGKIDDKEAEWLEEQDGSDITYEAKNDISFDLGKKKGTDHVLDLKFFDTETFTLKAGRHIYMDDDSILTHGGNIGLFADSAGSFGTGNWFPSDGIGTIYLGTGAGLKSNGGKITLSGAGLDFTRIIDAGSGDVAITTTASGIEDKNSATAYDIIANKLSVNAPSLGSASDAIDTQIKFLDATTPGQIYVSNTNNGLDTLTVTNAAAGDKIGIWTNNDMNVGHISSPSEVLLSSSGGAIRDSGATSTFADLLRLYAQTGINLHTQVNNLHARNSGLGDIAIDNIGNLRVEGAPSEDYGVQNLGAGSAVSISAHSDLTVDSAVNTNNGDVTLTADGSITHNAAGDVTTNGGNFIGNAAVNGGSGSYTINSGAAIDTTGNGDGNAEVIAGKATWSGSNLAGVAGGGDITIDGAGTDVAINSGAGDSYILTGGGNIGGNAYIAAQGNNVLLYAPKGGIGTMAGALNTKVVNLAAKAKNIINLFQRTGLNVASVAGVEGITGDKDIHLLVGDSNFGPNHDLNLINRIKSTAAAGLVDIDVAFGGIYGNNNPDPDIVSRDLDMYARDSMGTGSNRIDTKIENLWALSEQGDIYLDEQNDIDLRNVQVNDGAIDIISGGEMRARNVVNNGGMDNNDIRLTTRSGDIEVDNIYAAGRGDVILDSANDITNSKDGCLITADDLEMYADGGIGSASDRIKTKVNDLWAYADSGNVYLKEQDGINLWDVQARGSAIDIITGGDTHVYNLLATGFGAGDPALINLKVNNGDLNVDGSVVARHFGFGGALINLEADQKVVVKDSLIKAVTDGGLSSVTLTSGNDMRIKDSLIKAEVKNLGVATIDMKSGQDMDILRSKVLAEDLVLSTASINLKAQNDISIRNSELSATNDAGNARIGLDAGRDIEVRESKIKAQAGNTAIIAASAGRDINVQESRIKSQAGNTAIISAQASRDINIIESKVKAEATNRDGTAQVIMDAGRDLNIVDSQVRARAIQTATVALTADRNIEIKRSKIKARAAAGLAGVSIDAGRNIKVKDNSIVKAESANGNAVTLLQAGRNIRVDETSRVSSVADNLALTLLLAGKKIIANNISARSRYGLAGVGLLSLRGDIVADNINAVGNTFGGILAGSLLGNIYLGDLNADIVMAAALGGSIYDKGDVNARYLGLLARNDIGTALNPIRTNVDYLAAYSFETGDIYIDEQNDIQLGFNIPDIDLTRNLPFLGISPKALANFIGMPVPNILTHLPVRANDGNIYVKAGGDINVYRVNAQGNGSTTGNILLDAAGSILGVGRGTHLISAGDTLLHAQEVIGGYPDGPLNVDINGDLLLDIDNRQGSADGSVGITGVSGTLGGRVGGNYIFIPGVYTNPPFTGNPPGYVFFNGLEIWPLVPPPSPLGTITTPEAEILASLLKKNLRAYYQLMRNFRLVFTDLAQPNQLYGYHPLTETDFSAFDAINLDAGAYDFIDNNINLKGPLSTYFGTITKDQ
jgi:filamentous hemagglutinin family protein